MAYGQMANMKNSTFLNQDLLAMIIWFHELVKWINKVLEFFIWKYLEVLFSLSESNEIVFIFYFLFILVTKHI